MLPCPTSRPGRIGRSCSIPQRCPGAAAGRRMGESHYGMRWRISNLSQSIWRWTWQGGLAPRCAANSPVISCRWPRMKPCISPCSTANCAHWEVIMARCPRMADCGRRQRKPRMTSWPGWRLCRWCWKPAGSTSLRQRSTNCSHPIIPMALTKMESKSFSESLTTKFGMWESAQSTLLRNACGQVKILKIDGNSWSHSISEAR